MKNKMILFLCIIFSLSNICFAGKMPKPKKGEVVVIAKVKVNTLSSMDFFEKAFGLTEKTLKNKNSYFFPFYTINSFVAGSKISEFEEMAEAEDGEYCAFVYPVSKKGYVYFVNPIRYLFHKVYDMDIMLPTFFKAAVPEGAKYIYIGDLTYTVDNQKDFNVVDLKVSDSYKDAEQFLLNNKVKELNLFRTEILKITSSDDDDINKRFSVSLDGGEAEIKKGVYTYR